MLSRERNRMLQGVIRGPIDGLSVQVGERRRAAGEGGGRHTRLFLQLSVIGAAVGFGAAWPAFASSYYWRGGVGGSGNWSDTTWSSPAPTSPSVGTLNWFGGSDAIFQGSAAIISVNQAVSANSLTFVIGSDSLTNGGGSLSLGSPASGSIVLQAAGTNTPIAAQIVTAGPLIVAGAGNANTKTKGGIDLQNDSNLLAGGIQLIGGPVHLQVGSGASTHQGSQVFVSSLSTQTITVNANNSCITMDGSAFTNDFVISNNFLLNSTGTISNFTFALGGGSVFDSGVFTNAPAPVFQSTNFAGQISGTGDVLVTNDFFGGGGKGYTIFSNSSNNYTGKTIINNNGQNFLTFIVGADTAIPKTSDLVLGAFSVGQRLGVAKTYSKAVGAIDLNGFNTTVRSLSSDLTGSGVGDLGLTSLNNNGINSSLTTGANAISTLTIDSQGAGLTSTFAGDIRDGADFNAAADAWYRSQGATNTNFTTANGLRVGLTLAATNRGTLTLGNNNGDTLIPNTFSYTGGTTVMGGALYVNGTMQTGSRMSGQTASAVLVMTPSTNSGYVSVLGGSGTINRDVHVQGKAVLAPGASSVATGTLSITNLTMDGDTRLNFVVNDGSTSSTFGSGSSGLAVTGTFVESGVTSAHPITVGANGPFNGFTNYLPGTWNLATFTSGGITGGDISGGSVLLDPSAPPVNPTLTSGGTFSLFISGSTLQLLFAPSPTATNLLWAPGGSTGNWDSSTIAWQDLRHGNVGTSFATGGNVTFGTIATNNIVSVQGAGVGPASTVFSHSANAYTVTGGSINGAGPVSMNGKGKLILTQTNGYSGGTAVYLGGTIETQASGAMGATTGGIALWNGTWLTTTVDQVYGNSVQVFGSAGAGTTSVINTTTNLMISGSIGGTGTLTKTGPGTLTVNGTVGQGGDLLVQQGKLVLISSPGYGGATSVSAGAGLVYSQPAGAGLALQPSSSLSGDLTFTNPLLTVILAAGSYQAPIQSQTGRIYINGSSSSFQGGGGNGGGAEVDLWTPIVLNPATPALGASFNAYFGMSGASGSFVLNGSISGTGNVYYGAGPTGGGAAAIYVNATGSYSGSTHIINGGSAILSLGVNNAFPTTTMVTMGDSTVDSDAGFLDLNGHNQTLAGIQTDHGGVGGLTNSQAGLQSLLTLNGATSSKYNASIQGYISFNIALQNTSVFTMGASDTYSGTTTVTSGVLQFSDANAFSPFTNLVLHGGVVQGSSAFTLFNETLGTDPTNVQVLSGNSGFSAHGGPTVVNLNGDQSTLTWGDPNFQPTALVLNETTATQTLDFQNPLDLNGTVRTVNVNANIATLSGTLTGSGTSGLFKGGTGMLVLGTTNTYGGHTTVNAGILEATTTTSLPGYNIGGKISVNNGGTLAVVTGIGGGGGTGWQPADIDALKGAASFAAGSALGFDTTNNGNFTYASNITNANAGVMKLGTGTLVLTGTNTFSGTTTVNGGELDMPRIPGTAAALTGGKLKLTSPAVHSITTLTSLSVLPKTANQLDAGVSDLIVTGGSANESDVSRAIAPPNQSGPNGTFVTSGVLSGAEYARLNGGNFHGSAPQSTDLVLQYTYAGDANLSGLISIDDFLQVDNGYLFGLAPSWANGDFNHDGLINVSDFALIDYNFAHQGGTPLALLSDMENLHASWFGPSYWSALSSAGTSALTAVPEPASLATLALGAMCLMRRRRRFHA